MNEDRTRFNPDMLVLARESRGMTQADVAERSHISQGSISKWENRLAEPFDGATERLSAALHYPTRFFYQPEAYYGLPPTFYRKRASVGKRMLNRLHARMTVIRLHLVRLLRSVTLEPGLPLPELEVDEQGSPEEVARVLRATWMVRAGPIPALVDLLERAGILVIPLDPGIEKVDAVGWNLPDLPPLIFFNPAAPPDRIRFSIAHELGHLVMHRIPTEDMEGEANRFAAEFLAPSDQLAGHLRELSLERLARLKLVWRISMAALLYRAKELDCLTDRQYRYYWTQFGKRGWRTREPGSDQIPLEEASLLNGILQLHLTDLGYTLEDLATALNSTPTDLGDLYGLGEPPLRVIR